MINLKHHNLLAIVSLLNQEKRGLETKLAEMEGLMAIIGIPILKDKLPEELRSSIPKMKKEIDRNKFAFTNMTDLIEELGTQIPDFLKAWEINEGYEKIHDLYKAQKAYSEKERLAARELGDYAIANRDWIHSIDRKNLAFNYDDYMKKYEEHHARKRDSSDGK